ncbi:hypothetical protein KSH72_027310, partial [Escherichia coli]|nr:hypothetical protein [Escherichia coli]
MSVNFLVENLVDIKVNAQSFQNNLSASINKSTVVHHSLIDNLIDDTFLTGLWVKSKWPGDGLQFVEGRYSWLVYTSDA